VQQQFEDRSRKNQQRGKQMANAMTIHVSVVSAEEEIFDGEAEFVALPGESGELGIYPMHTPLITRIRPGTVRILVPGKSEEELVFVAGGILEVQPDEVTVLAETAIRGRDLDEAKAAEAKKQAEEAMSNRDSKIDYAKAQAELAEAVAQLQAISRMRHKR
jgi:F-type H+-transporting ATPase subunit epsilon